MPTIARRISMPGFFRGLAFAAAAALMCSTAPLQRADAMSLITPGATPTARAATDGLMTEVRGGHGGGGFHGGGFHGGFHGGGFHGFHGGGGWHGGGWHGGGFRYGGFHHYGGYRFAHFHHFHRRFFYGGGYYPYYHHTFCRIVWTYYGPRRVCGWRHWYHRHYYW